MRAVLFPGQGSQFVGMGLDFYEKFDSVKTNFKIVDETLGFSLSKMILNGPDSDLKLTQNTQPAIMTIGFSIFKVLNEEYKLNLNNSKFFAGHSLGEYTALVCAGALTLERAAYLLHERGKSMQAAVPAGEGAMMAILGMSLHEVEDEIKLLPETKTCEIANENSNGQIVVSGKKNIIENFNQNLKNKKKKCILLPVSAPFHCKLMNPATEIMKKEIDKLEFKDSKNKIVANVTAKEVHKADEIKRLLISQIESPVRWRESILYMIEKGTKTFVEIGPGKVLSGMIKRIDKNVNVVSINESEDLTKLEIND